jgi:GNAT superfamily N-acetyltransferase
MSAYNPAVDRILARMGSHIPRFLPTEGVRQPMLSANAWSAITLETQADFNMAHIKAACAESDLTALIAELADRAAIVLGHPGDTDSLAPLVETLGLTNAGNAPLMVYSLNGGVQDDDIERVTDAAGLDELAGLMESAFSLTAEGPSLRTGLIEDPSVDGWLLRVDGVPRSGLITTRDDDLVGVYCMSTPAEFARRGYGRRVLNHVLGACAATGAQYAYLVATPAGFPLYRATGFDTLAELPIWVAGHSTQFH